MGRTYIFSFVVELDPSLDAVFEEAVEFEEVVSLHLARHFKSSLGKDFWFAGCARHAGVA